jgi:hypothetical protein
MITLELHGSLYIHVADTVDLFVNREGHFINGTTKETVPDIESQVYNYRIIKYLFNGQKAYRRVARLIAKAFVPIPEDLKEIYLQNERNVLVAHRDEDQSNCAVENLYWVDKKGRAQDTWALKIAEEEASNPASKFTNPFDGIYPNALESRRYPGFFYIPFSSKALLIRKDGVVFDPIKNKVKEPTINHKGYRIVSFRKRGRGTCQVPVHRLVALMFSAKPERHQHLSYDDLEVNHLDGNKSHNNASNLEWVTTAENLDHAWETGLIDTGTRVLAKNLFTGEIQRYTSINACAKAFGLRGVALNFHLNSPAEALIEVDGYIFKKDDGGVWPNRVLHRNGRTLLRKQLDVVVKDTASDKLYVFTDMAHACDGLGLSRTGLKYHRESRPNDMPYKGFLFFLMQTLTKDDLRTHYDTLC